MSMLVVVVGALPALAQPTLPGFEYREKWNVGPWEGSAGYDRGKFVACGARFVPGDKLDFALSGNGKASAVLVFQTGPIDAATFFSGKRQKKKVAVFVGDRRRDFTVEVPTPTYFEVAIDDVLLDAIGRGGPFSFAVDGGGRWNITLPAESGDAIGRFRKCLADHRT